MLDIFGDFCNLTDVGGDSGFDFGVAVGVGGGGFDFGIGIGVGGGGGDC